MLLWLFTLLYSDIKIKYKTLTHSSSLLVNCSAYKLQTAWKAS